MFVSMRKTRKCLVLLWPTQLLIQTYGREHEVTLSVGKPKGKGLTHTMVIMLCYASFAYGLACLVLIVLHH